MDTRVKSPFDYAELYDILFANLDFDRGFYLNLALKARGPVLEVACGTGRILIPCLQKGVEIDGLDLYPAMLECLRAKALRLSLQPRLYLADMRDFTLTRRYELIFIAFNSFVHNLTTDDQLKTLRDCREHLLPDGELVFNVFYPGLEILGGEQNVRVLTAEVSHPRTGLPVRMYETRTLNRVEQIRHSRIEVQELDPEGQVSVSHYSETDVRWIFKPEMELLVRVAGYSRWRICGGFDARPLASESETMVVFARK